MYSLQIRRGTFISIVIIGLAIFLGGCVTLPDPEVSQDLNPDIIGVIDPSHNIGQTIEIRRNNFNGITIWLSVNIEKGEEIAQTEQLLHVDLYPYPEPVTPLDRVTVSLEYIPDKRPATITFNPKANSEGNKYFLLFSTDHGYINVFGKNEDNYPGGQAFVNMQAVDADVAFNTTYDYNVKMLFSDCIYWLRNAWLVLPLALILLIPGLLLLMALGDFSSLDIGKMIGISVGLSLATIPLVILWSSTIGILWNKTFMYFLSGFSTSILIILFVRNQILKRCFQKISKWFKKHNLGKSSFNWSDLYGLFSPLSLISIFLISLAVRLIMIRDLATPAWVDSIHHALITRIILETGGLPKTYLPYLNIEPTFYHPGFHSQLAAFQLLSGLRLDQGMLIFGQVINALIVFSIYTLASSMTNNRFVGIFAAMITGLFTPMPAYYTSWGRYTQLSGLLILPIAYVYYKNAVYRYDGKLITPPLIIASIAAAGLFLVHYRVTAFLVLLLISDFLIRIITKYHKQIPLKLQIYRILYFALFSALLTLPWLTRAIPNTFLPSISQTIPEVSNWFSDFSWRYLNAALGQQALALAGLGLLWGLFQKKRFAFILFVWVVLLGILANLSSLGIPGGGFINTTSVEITLFIPISILAGFLIMEIIKSWKLLLPKQIQPVLIFGIGILSITISIIGAQNITPILNPVTFLSREADIPAILWVNENIPKDERILINPFAWGYGLYAGNDGGYWITPLSGRATIPPPALYALTTEEDVNLINHISQYAINNGANAEGLHDLLTQNDVRYIFLGARGGPISTQSLISFSGFNIIYDHLGVHIFEVLP